jgi:hypothetical protein
LKPKKKTEREIHLKKKNGGFWKYFESQTQDASIATVGNVTKSVRGPKNWDSLVKEELKADDKPDANNFFNRLYEYASEEEKRAMAKSYVQITYLIHSFILLKAK